MVNKIWVGLAIFLGAFPLLHAKSGDLLSFVTLELATPSLLTVSVSLWHLGINEDDLPVESVSLHPLKGNKENVLESWGLSENELVLFVKEAINEEEIFLLLVNCHRKRQLLDVKMKMAENSESDSTRISFFFFI